jgi:type II secretory pathway component PulF
MFIGIWAMLIVAVIVGIPMVQKVFDEVGADTQLPGITMWFAGVVDKLMLYWYIPLFIVIALAAAFIVFINTTRGRYQFDYFKYTMPIFGQLIYLIDFSRLTKNMLLNLQNGMRIQDALEISKNVVKNVVMLSMIETAINNIFIGQSWIDPFDNNKFTNKMTIEMLRIGMQTDLTEMMEKLLVYMDTDIDNTMEKVMKVLPEFTYLFVGGVLIFFVVVVLVPVIQVYMGGFLFDAYT